MMKMGIGRIALYNLFPLVNLVSCYRGNIFWHSFFSRFLSVWPCAKARDKAKLLLIWVLEFIFLCNCVSYVRYYLVSLPRLWAFIISLRPFFFLQFLLFMP